MAWRAGKGQRGGHGKARVALETGGPIADGGFYLLQGATSTAASSETASGPRETHPAPPNLASPIKCALNVQDSVGKDKF